MAVIASPPVGTTSQDATTIALIDMENLRQFMPVVSVPDSFGENPLGDNPVLVISVG